MSQAWGVLRQFPGLLASGVGLALRGDDPQRWRLAATYARLETKALLLRALPRLTPASERVLGWDIAFSHYATLAYLFRDVFLVAPYRVPAASASPVVVDCGANIGLSVLYFRRRFPQSRIVAFEPDPDAFALLRRNLDRNGAENVEAHRVAVGGSDGTVRFFYDPARPAGAHAGAVGRATLEASREVEARRLSAFLPASVDVLKLDVEGLEAEVIQELEDSGALDRVTSLVVEYHLGLDGRAALGEMLTLLEGAGFGYHLATAEDSPVLPPDSFQDVLLYAHRRAA